MKWMALLLVFLFNTVVAYCQDNYKSFSFFFAPSFAFSSLTETHSSLAEFVDLRKENDNAKGGIYLGAFFEKGSKKNIGFQTGLTVSLLQITSGQKVADLDHLENNTLRTGYFYAQDFYHAGVPLNIKKSFFSKERGFCFYALAGVEFNYLLSASFQRSYILNNGNFEHTYNEFENNLENRRINWSGVVGVGTKYSLDNIILFIQPTFRTFLMNQWQDGLKEQIATFNLIMGVEFKKN